MNPNRKINVLWLDDELEFHPAWFADVKRHMEADHPDVHLETVHTVERFAEVLKSRAALKINDALYIDWIWLDVMIKPFKAGETFACLGFSEERRIALVVGAQILGLMQNKTPLVPRADWLSRYEKRPTSLLTSLLTIHSDWQAYVDPDVRGDIQYFAAMVKEFDYITNVVKVGEELKTHIEKRVALCRRLIEESHVQNEVSS